MIARDARPVRRPGGGSGRLLARTELAAPAVEAPFRMVLQPLRGDLLALHHAGHRVDHLDRRGFLVAYIRTAGKTDDQNKSNHSKNSLTSSCDVPRLAAMAYRSASGFYTTSIFSASLFRLHNNGATVAPIW